jgi:hypothetical protein
VGLLRGSTALLVTIVAFNLAAISFYVPQISGPEVFLAGHPKLFASVILVHIITGLLAVGFLAKRRTHKKDTIYVVSRYWGALRSQSVFGTLILVCVMTALVGFLLFPEQLARLAGGRAIIGVVQGCFSRCSEEPHF